MNSGLTQCAVCSHGSLSAVSQFPETGEPNISTGPSVRFRVVSPQLILCPVASMQGQSDSDFSRASSFGPPTSFPVPNVPGLATDGYPSHYHDAPQGANGATYSNDPTYGNTYPRALVPPWPQPRLPEEYDTYQASRQPPLSRSPSVNVQLYSVRSGNGPYPLVSHQRSESGSSGSTSATWSPPQDPADVQVVLEGSYSQVAGYSASMAASESPPGSYMFGSVQWPSAPQEYDPSGEHELPPLMPDPMPFFRDTGRRRALIIGINYSMHRDRNLELRKCIEDAYGMANFLCASLKFKHKDVRVMTDNNPFDHPTHENILHAMRALVYGANPHDHLVFYFSGHALQVEDLSQYKPNGLIESRSSGICAMDFHSHEAPNANTRGVIVDSVMHELMVKCLPQKCRLTTIFDSCHSGTLLDLPYVYDHNGNVKPHKHPETLKILRQRSSHADVISLSASKDEQEALETARGGALRWAFIGCVGTFGSALTYRELLRGVRDYMRRHRFPQKPQLTSSHEIDTNILFTT